MKSCKKIISLVLLILSQGIWADPIEEMGLGAVTSTDGAGIYLSGSPPQNSAVNYGGLTDRSAGNFGAPSVPEAYSPEQTEYLQMLSNPYGTGVDNEVLLSPNRAFPLPGDGYELPPY